MFGKPMISWLVPEHDLYMCTVVLGKASKYRHWVTPMPINQVPIETESATGQLQTSSILDLYLSAQKFGFIKRVDKG